MNDNAQTPTIGLLKNGLAKLGYAHDSFMLGTTNFTQFTAPSGQIWLTESSRIAYPFMTLTAKRVSTFKNLAYALATRIGAQVPFTATLDSQVDNSSLYAELLQHSPLIVKPNSASLSRGLTLNISDPVMLAQAIKDAGAFSDLVLVQKQLSGEEVRFIVVGNKVRAALLRQTPRVTGDGVSTLGQLIVAENNLRRHSEVPYPVLTDKILDSSKLDLQALPAAGEMVELGRGTMIARGASMYDVRDQVHPSYIAVAEKLAGALGTGFVAVDIFIKDYSSALNNNDYAFIEYNMSPVLNLLYRCRDGRHYDILSDLIPLIDSRINAGLA